jgi:pimeloyl-ACP methyl ester carboxylesterase
MSLTASAGTYAEIPNHALGASNGVNYTYRDAGDAPGAPLVALQHFRGNLDSWDPALIDALTCKRRVIAFDNRGVGRSTGRTRGSIKRMAIDAIVFIEALQLDEVDLLGFSIGSLVAQEIALIRPALV